jgi:acyl-CoA synthetase (AMP-forming)/AMP-acid ligase II
MSGNPTIESPASAASPAHDSGGRPELIIERHYDGRSVRCFAQRPAHVDAMFRATVAQMPGNIALVFEGERIDYAEFARRVDVAVAQFAARGIRRGDRVALLLGNRPAFAYALLAVARLGAVAVPMNTRQRAPEIAYMLDHCGASVLVYDAACGGELPDGCASVHSYFRVDDRSSLQLDTPGNAAPAPNTAVESPAIAEEDAFCILYTSGTTGKPKGAMQTHLGILHSTLHYQYALGLRADDAALLAVPASHVTGLVAILLAMIRVGGRTLIMEQFNARAFLEFAARERMTYTLVVPAIYNLCLLQPDFATFDLSAWRVGGFGGAPMPAATVQRLAAQLPQLALVNVYGATETTGPAVILPLGADAPADVIGRTAACADIRVVDTDGNDVPTGAAGELLINGPMTVPGYWDNPTANATSFVDGYWRSGDIGSIDAQGWVRVFDRQKDMINRAGYKVYSAEVENVLSHHPGVVECAIVGRPDPVLGERVHAFVVRKRDDISDVELREFCSSRLSDYKVPETFSFIEVLPRNAAGKILKPDLRALLDAESRFK